MKRVLVHADDLGMAPAVNAAIAELVRSGVVTHASLMATGPAFAEAAELARRDGIPCAAHLVLASDCNRAPYRPLTAGPTLVDPTGYFPPHVRDLQGVARRPEVVNEFIAQVNRLIEAGIEPIHLDSHIMLFDQDVMADLCRHFGLRSRDLLPAHPELNLPINSLFHLTPIEPREKRDALNTHLDRLSDGTHWIVVHPAHDATELDALCDESWPGRRRWVRELRVSDMEVLLDPRIASRLRTGW